MAAQGAPPEGPAGFPQWMQDLAALHQLAGFFPGVPPAMALAAVSQLQRSGMLLPASAPWGGAPPPPGGQHPMLSAPPHYLQQPSPAHLTSAAPFQQRHPGLAAAAAPEAAHSEGGQVRAAASVSSNAWVLADAYMA